MKASSRFKVCPSSFDYKCIAFYKFYTQTETNFYEKQDRSRPDLFDC
jgi:hypothetical protein